MDGCRRRMSSRATSSLASKHQLFDQLVRDVVLDLFEAQRLALRIQPDLDLGKLEIERAGGETLATQERRQFPGDVELARESVMRAGAERVKASLYVRRAALRITVFAKRAEWTFPLRLISAKTEKVR